jgi:hypothetical protein
MKPTDVEIARMGRVRFLWFILRAAIGSAVDYLPTVITRGRLFDLNEAAEIRDMALEALKESAALRSENERLREALSFYANPEVYKPHPDGLGFDRRDLSFHARAALNGEGA